MSKRTSSLLRIAYRQLLIPRASLRRLDLNLIKWIIRKSRLLWLSFKTSLRRRWIKLAFLALILFKIIQLWMKLSQWHQRSQAPRLLKKTIRTRRRWSSAKTCHSRKKIITLLATSRWFRDRSRTRASTSGNQEKITHRRARRWQLCRTSRRRRSATRPIITSTFCDQFQILIQFQHMHHHATTWPISHSVVGIIISDLELIQLIFKWFDWVVPSCLLSVVCFARIITAVK